jgi:glucose/mannose-6-phosphate isomerase
MLELISGFGNQLRHALEVGEQASLKQTKKIIKNVMITGLGGSGIGGTMVSELAAKKLFRPNFNK